GLREEFYKEFAEQFAGREIVWNPQNETARAVKEQLISNNAFGTGLNYYPGRAEAAETRVSERQVKRLERYLPGLQAQERPVALALAGQLAKSLNKTADEFLDGFEMTGELPGEYAAQAAGKQVKGAAFFRELAGDVKAVMYVSENADFSTWAHELTHIYRRMLRGDLLAGLEKALGVEGGDWTERAWQDKNGELKNHDEQLAELVEDYLTEGKAPAPGLRGLFEKIADFMRAIYRALRNGDRLTPEIRAVLDRIFSGEAGQNRQDADTVKSEADAEMRQRFQESPYGERLNERINELNREGRERAMEIAREEGTTGTTVEGPLLQVDIKNGDNLQAEKSYYKANVQRNVEWLLNAEPVAVISENAINIDSLEGKNFVDKIYNLFVQNKTTQVMRGDWKINLSKSGIRASRQKGLSTSKINAFAALPEIITQGIITDVNRNWKNRGYDSYFINAPLKIGDGEYIAEVIINHGKDGIGNFYLHEVEEKSKLRGVKQTGMDTRTPEGASKLNIAHLLVESNTENENPSILFQLTEKEIQEEARRYSSPQAWKEADETGALMGITPVLPGDLTGEAAGAWYQAKWEEAHRGAETQGTETAPEAGNAEAIDQAFIQNEVQPAGKLEAFLKEVNRIDMTEAWQPEDEREQLAVDRHIYLQDRIRRELRHGVWLSNAKRAARGTPLTEATRKRMISLIKAAPRDYRSLWAEAMNLPEYEVSSEDTGKAALGSLLGSPDERFAKAVSPEQIRKLARDIQDEDIRKAVESGEIKIDDPKADRYVRLLRGDLRKLAKQLKQLKERTDADLRDISDPIVRKLLKQYDELNALRLAAAEAEAGMQRQLRNRIKVTEKYQQEAFQKRHDAIALQEQIENALANAEASAEAREAIARKETEYKIRAKYQKKLREQRNLAKIRELKKRIARVTQQKISYDTVYHEQAKKIIVLQQWTLPLMQKGINRWLGTEGSILKSIYDQFNGDEHFRDKIRRSLAKQKKDKAGISTGELYARGQNVFNKITEIMGKNYEGMTRQDRLYLREKLPMKQLIERDEIILKHFFTSYKIDEEFRENAGNFIPEDMAKKQYEDLSSDEKMFIAAGIQDEDWRAKLGWYGLFDERKGYIPLDIREKRDNFGDVEEARPGEEEYALMRDSLPAALFRRIQERPYADWTIEEAAELAEVVNDWKAEGKAILAERREIERRLIDKYQDEILKTVRTAGKARGADAEKLKKILGKYDRGMIGAENSRIKELPFKYAVENGRRLFRFMDGDRNGGIFSTLLIWLEDEAFNEEMRNRYRRMDKMDKVMKDAGIEALELYTNKFTLANLYGDGRDIEISLDKALHIREAGKNERSKQAVMYGNLLLPGERAQAQALDDITAFADRARGRYERIVTEANQFLDQNRKFLKLTGAIAEDYDQQYPRMNRVSLDRYNAPVFKEENYTPIGRLQGTGDIHESKLAAEAKRAAGAGLLAYADKGTFKSRINIGLAHQAPIKLGLYETWVENVEETEHAMAIAQYEKILNTVFKGRGPRAQEIRLAIANRYGKEGMKYIDNYINDIISPESPEAQGIIRYLRGNTAAAYLAFRVRSLVTQAITSPAPFFQYMNPAEYAQAAAELAGNYTVLSDFIKKESVFMRSRQGSLAIASVKEMTEKADNPRRAKYNELIKTGMNGLELVDWTCVAPGWLAVYWRELGRITAENANLKEDTALSTEEIRAEAVRLADDVVRLTQPSSRKVDLAPLFKSNNEFFRAFLQFQGSLNVIFQNVFIDTPYFMRTRQYEKVTGGLLAYAASSLVLGAVLTGSGGEDKEPDEQAKQAVFFALAQFSDSIPVAGSAATAILERMITGKGGYQSPNNLLPVLDKTSLALSAAAQAIYEEDQKKRKKATLRAAGQAAEAAGIFGGFPVSALKDIGKALDIGDGDGQLGFHPEALIGRQVKKE
ncbi:MAG: hypothetical protein LBU19_04630, partial [Treponema sp.]|nr:hypothetical protein [Treponema sp.]